MTVVSELGYIDGMIPPVPVGPEGTKMRVVEGTWKLDEDDFLVLAMLCDPIFCAELLFEDPLNHTNGGCYTVYDYQYPLFRPPVGYAAFPCARSTGKTESIKARSVSHAFKRRGEDMLLTAPELIHLEALTQHVEQRLTEVRLTREFLKKDSQKTGFTHKPFMVEFSDGTRILGRIPHLTGRGVKGAHEPDLIMDEAQDYPPKGYTEVHETVMKDHVDSTGELDFTYHLYGVHSGAAGGRFENLAESGEFKVYSVTALMRPGWNKAEKAAAAAMYGGTHSPDYRRNILGEPGTALSQFFVTSRLMSCFPSGTPVRTKNGTTPIESLRRGDGVLNATGEGRVRSLTKTEHRRIAVVKLNTGEQIVCSPEHPFFTEHGWCHADWLRPGWQLYRQSEVLRGMRGHSQDAPGPLLLEGLRREMAGHDGGGRSELSGANDARLRGLRGDIHTLRGRAFLRAGVHGPGDGRGAAAPVEAMRDMRRGVSAAQTHHGLLQPQMPGCQGCGDQRATAGRQHEIGEKVAARRFARAAVQAVASAWPGEGLVRAVLRGTQTRVTGSDEFHCGYCFTDADDRRGGGRQGSRGSCAASEGRCERRRSRRIWVEGVEIYEPGSDGWARHCGEADSITLYDLTVEGHPSFAVGDNGLLVHNCLDQDAESAYNTVEFRDQHLIAEDVDKMVGPGMSVSALLDLPPIQGPVYAGMDVGLVNDPTVITLFTIAPDKDKKLRLKLLRIIHLWRFRERMIRECAYRIDMTYAKRLKSFGTDMTGLGLPLLQALEDDEECPEHLREIIRGYVFNAMVPVAVAEEDVTTIGDKMVDRFGNMVKAERDIWTGKDRFVSFQTMIEASTRYLRNWVDTGYLLLPFHQGLVKDMQGETEQRVRAMGAKHLRKKPAAFHMLDSMRAAAMAYEAESVEDSVMQPDHTPVLDTALDLAPGIGGGMGIEPMSGLIV